MTFRPHAACHTLRIVDTAYCARRGEQMSALSNRNVLGDASE